MSEGRVQPTPSGQGGRPNYDQILKWMLTQAHDAFLNLVAPGLLWVGERSPVLPTQPREADLVWEVERQSGGRGLLHVELQIKPLTDMGERVAEYAIRLWRRDHLPVRSVVIYLREAASTPHSPFVIPWEENDDSLRYRYDVLRLWEIPQEVVLSSPDYMLWPLAGLMGGATPETTVQVAERIAALPAPHRERSDLVGALVGLAGIREARDTLLDALRRNHMLDELFRESGILQAYAEEIAAQAATKAAAEGRAQGEQEMVRLALEGRFGTLPEDVLSALATANEATLRAIIGRIAAISLDEVRAELSAAQAK